ncbi:integrase core domain-containing protein [Cupriavidus sp. L7L]|uniref:integrase core domain-containing protein n=1 Tax=Cupriavidus sp. L7L TaxID=2546443 RepID=UPI0014055069|nr:integrase core domain-containing protein [Cupriavidus sp. L7L]
MSQGSDSSRDQLRREICLPAIVNGSVDEARAWTQQFVRWYNHEHKHSGLKFVTPAQRHGGTAAVVLAHREAVYAEAKARTPERWSGSTRNWSLADEVWLNPERIEPAELKQVA